VVRIADSPWLSLVDAEGRPLPAPPAAGSPQSPGPAPDGSVVPDATPGACLTHLGATPGAGADGGGDTGPGGDGSGDDGSSSDGSASDPSGGSAARDQRRDDWVVLHAPVAGTYRIAAPYKLPRGTACPTPGD
jgi:hypothetical protein